MATTTYGTPYVQSSDLVSAYPGTSSTLATRVDDISLKGNGINDQTGTAYTLVLADGGKTITLSNAAAVTVTLPTNASVAFPAGTSIRLVNKGAGTVTIQPAGGVTLNGGNLTLPQFGAVQIVKLETNTWGQLDYVGTAPGLIPISPTSLANSGGSASASGAAVTFTGVTSVSLNGVFTSAYENYRIILNVTASSASVITANVRLRASGTDATSGYKSILWTAANAWTSGAAASDQKTDRANVGFRHDTTTMSSSTFDVNGPQAAVETQIMGFYNSTINGNAGITNSILNNTTQYDGLTIYMSTGTCTGTATVYGYRKN